MRPDALLRDGEELLGVVPVVMDRLLVPGARLVLARQDLADAAGEAALLGLDEVADDLVGAPLFLIEVPGAVVAEGFELALDERTGGLEINRDLIGRELRRRGHEMS